jgi:cystathionine beta-lyase family protein involved in aluminum resistance
MESYRALGFGALTVSRIESAEKELASGFAAVDQIANINQARVLGAFAKCGVESRHMQPSTGYGYSDIGREMLERVFAACFGCEDAIVRPHIVSGTHAIAIALFGLLSSGQKLLYATGRPYDTLWRVIGIESSRGSLAERGVGFSCIDLNAVGGINLSELETRLHDDMDIAVVALQRSAGYAWRRALTIDEIGEAAALVHRVRPGCLVFVDNCYGEFADTKEPTAIGADLVAGSLIKNPGGGLAPTGGYLCGTFDAVKRVEAALTAPGIGRECGSYEAPYRPFFQGLFMAPAVVASAMKTAMLFSFVFESLGYRVKPSPSQRRDDPITAIEFKSREALLAFCGAIQKASPIDAMAKPEPWAMPGYSHDVVMAAGTFVQGASIELTADGPLCEPYTGYLQGSLTYAHGRLACMMAVESSLKH